MEVFYSAVIGISKKGKFLSKDFVWGYLIKKLFLGILQNSQENTFVRVSFLIKL